MDKPISAKRLLANQQNGRKSRGPVTIEGKARASKNSCKHGILASQVLLPSESDEDKDSFANLLSQLKEDYEPVGIQEELLVEEICTCYWRKRRVLKAQGGAIDLQAEEHGKVTFETDEPVEDDALLRRERPDVDKRLTFIENCYREVNERGYLCKASLAQLGHTFHNTIFHITDNTVECCRGYGVLSQIACNATPPLEGLPSVQDCRLIILRALEKLHIIEKSWAKIDLRRERKQTTSSPRTGISELALDRFLRYEVAVDRQLYRAIAMLDHLQSRRKANALPQLTV